MPSLDGQAVFGVNVVMSPPADVEFERQENPYPGLSGLQSLPMGARGRFTTVSGLFIGVNPADLSSAIQLYRSFNDGQVHVLVNTLGETWQNVVYAGMETKGRIRQSPAGAYFIEYTGRWKHIS